MLNNTCKITDLLCKIGMHDMRCEAGWCDPDGTIVIHEYACSRCGKTAWSFAHFDAIACRVLARYPIPSSLIMNEKVNSGSPEKETCKAVKETARTVATRSNSKRGKKGGADKTGTEEAKTL